MTRKVVQLVVSPEISKHYFELFALCNDGTMWSSMFHRVHQWKQIPDVPQPEIIPPKKLLGRWLEFPSRRATA